VAGRLSRVAGAGLSRRSARRRSGAALRFREPRSAPTGDIGCAGRRCSLRIHDHDAGRRHRYAGCGELGALYVDPDYWGRGIGTVLVRAARARLRDQGFREAMLWLLAGNARGERFYRADGWVANGITRKDVVWGVEVDELRYRRRLD